MITVHKITGEVGTLGVSIVIDTAEDVEAFKKLVFRGANLWPDAPAEIKRFSDKLEQGEVLQDYSTQDTSPTACKHEWHDVYRGTKVDRHVCDKCGATKPADFFARNRSL